MGLRVFVALPLEQGGIVLRGQNVENLSGDRNIAIANFAYGITGNQTLLLGIPYRLSPSGDNRTGDLSALYRYTALQNDFPEGSIRVGLLIGGLIPTNSHSDGAVQAGTVATFYKGRHELDFDAVYAQAFGRSPDRALYDISYQFRLAPAEYPETLSSEWDVVCEYNGRWAEGNHLLHQATFGLQWIHPSWVLEGGFIQDINNPHDTQLLLSVRFHI